MQNELIRMLYKSSGFSEPLVFCLILKGKRSGCGLLFFEIGGEKHYYGCLVI